MSGSGKSAGHHNPCATVDAKPVLTVVVGLPRGSDDAYSTPDSHEDEQHNEQHCCSASGLVVPDPVDRFEDCVDELAKDEQQCARQNRRREQPSFPMPMGNDENAEQTPPLGDGPVAKY